MKSFTLALALGVLATVPASADEVWSLPSGNQIVYERDAGDVAVLSYKPEQGMGKGLIFVVGLGGVSEGRSRYQAYWTEDDDAGFGISETRNGASPVVLVLEGSPLLVGDPLSPLHQTRATPAGDDLAFKDSESIAVGHATGYQAPKRLSFNAWPIR